MAAVRPPGIQYYQPNAQSGAPRMLNIINFHSNANRQKENVDIFPLDNNSVDRESVRRRFGWSTLGINSYIPFILRDNDKYCATRMIDKFIMDTFLVNISDTVYFNCTNIPSYYATSHECFLLNEINEFHCDYYYSTTQFKNGDVLVRLDDIIEFYDYLVFCYNKLFNRPTTNDRCGFLAINQTSMVPYVISKEQKYLPLFYFEEADNINFKIHKISGWDLSYLKFCFKIQGIREEFCRNDVLDVLAIDEMKEYFEPNATFKEIWPTSSTERQSLIKTGVKSPIKAWFRQPTQPLKNAKQVPVRNPASAVADARGMYYPNIS